MRLTTGTVVFKVASTVDSVIISVRDGNGNTIETTVERFDLERAFVRSARGVKNGIASSTTLRLAYRDE
jgi:hypothetical protein